MKICLTVNSSPWSRFKGGGQIAVHHLASALCKKGHEVHVLYSKCPGESIRPDVDYKIHWVRHFNVATLNLNIFSFGRALSRLASKENFDIIHGNAEEAFFSADVCRRCGAAPFFTSHAPFIPRTGILGGLTHPVFLLKNLNSYLLRAAAAGAEQIITFSRFSKNLVVDGLGNSVRDKVQVVLPGIDPSWFEVKRNPSPKNQLLFWGRMEDEKGIAELLQAFTNIKKRHPEIRLHLVGEGNRHDAFKKLALDLGVAADVVFHGWQDTAQIQTLAAESLIAVFPSHIESFGLTAVEARAAALPVICSDAGALPEIVEDGVTGTVVPTGDIEKLTDTLLTVLANAPKYQYIADHGREPARRQFSWDTAAEKTLQLYSDAKTAGGQG